MGSADLSMISESGEKNLVEDEEVKGNALVRRATPDGATNIEFVDRGAGSFSEDGILSSVRFYSQSAGNKGLQFRVYRPQGGGFTLVGLMLEMATSHSMATADASPGITTRTMLWVRTLVSHLVVVARTPTK
jgi:hypothetical protein